MAAALDVNGFEPLAKWLVEVGNLNDGSGG